MGSALNKFLPWLAVGLMALACFFLMFDASIQESAIMDELAHIPAGYGYVRYLDFRLNPEHPPLLKALSALPLLFESKEKQINFPVDKQSWQTDINGQWQAGAQFLYESGNDADWIIQRMRLAPMILTILLLIFIYIWAKELIGRWWGLLPVLLFSFSPTVAAHGHYVTTDLAAAFGIFIASYYFIKFLFEPNRRHLIFSGLAFGMAQLMKFSAVLLIPFFAFLVLIFCFWEIRNRRFFKMLFRHILNLILIFIVGYVLVYAVYFLFTINYPMEKQVADTEFILTSFSGGPDPNLETCKLSSDISPFRRSRCLAEIDILMAKNRISRPFAEYFLGVLMVAQRSSGGNTSYFLGEVSASGWWYYFPVVFGLKEPIPSLVLIFIALLIGIWGVVKCLRFPLSCFKKFFDYLGTHFAEFSMLVFIILYWAYSMKSPLNIGVRHILPTLPFIYILVAANLKKWTYGKKLLSLKGCLVCALVLWYLAETLFVSPYFLSYFNQFAGGTDNGYQYVTDSNYDWGQDLKRLKNFVDQKSIGKIGVDYFGGGNPKYYLGDKAEYWWSAKGNPLESGVEWLAVSINTLQGAFGRLHPGQPRNPEDEYSWLKQIKNPYEPDYRAGKSIFIYKL